MTSHQENYRSYCKVAQIYNCYQSDYPKQDLIKKVLQKEGDINFKIPSTRSVISSEPDLAGGTALHIAAIENDVEIFDILLDKDADITIQNQQGRTPLHFLINQSYVKKELLDIVFSTHLSLGDPSNPCDVDGISHFHIACMKDYVNAVEFLLNGGIPVDAVVNANSKKFAGYTGLHFAAENCALATIKVLLKHNASMNVKDARGLTPFHLLLEQKIKMMDQVNAVDQQLPDTLTVSEIDDALNMLLDSNDVDELGLTHFHVACAMQDSSVAEYFLEQHIDTNRAVRMDSPFRPGYTALHFAAHCNLNTAKLLLRKHANFEVRAANGLAPMDLFWRLGKREDLLTLLKQHWNFVTFSDKRTRLLDFANLVWNHDALDQFLCSLDDFAITVSEMPTCWTGRTLLHFAVLLCCNVDTLMLLLNRGFAHHVDAPDDSGATPIHLAFRANKLDFVENLMNKTQAEENLVDKDGLSYLHVACALQKLDYVKKWCRHSKNRSAVCRGGYAHPRVKPGSTALHVAMASGNCQIISALLERGMNVLARDADGRTPLHRFLQLKVNVEDVCRTLLSARLVRDVCLIKFFGLSQLRLAIYCRETDVRPYVNADTVNAVVYCDDASSFMHRYDGCTPLQMAIKRRASASVITTLLELGADLLWTNCRGESPLYAALTGTPDEEIESVIITTLQSNAALRKQLEEMSGITMLHLACHVLNKDAISWMLIGNVDPKTRVKSGCPVWPGYMPLHVLMKAVEHRVVKDSFYQSFQLLMENGVDVAAVNADGETPIHLAFRNLSTEGMHHVLNELVANLQVFNVNPVSRDGISHFHAACLLNNAAAVKLFLENGVVDVNQPIDFFAAEFAGSSPLHLALENRIDNNYGDKQNIVSWLLNCGADVNAEDSRGHTPLHLAVKVKGPLSILEELVRHGAKFDSRNIFEQTPLELLAQSESVTAEGIQFFENAGCRLNSSNPLSGEGYISMLISHRYHSCYRDVIRDQPMTAILQQLYPTLTRMEPMVTGLQQQLLPIQTVLDTIDSSLLDDDGRSLIHNVVTSNDPIYELFSHDRLDRLIHTICTDIDLQDHKGKTALHLAAQFGNNLAVEKLLDSGADVNVVDAINQTALGYAIQYYDNKKYCPEQKCHMEVMIYLVAHLRSLDRLDLEVSDLNRRLKADAANIIPHDEFYGRDHIDADGLKKCTRSMKIANTDLRVGDFLSDTGKGLVSYAFMSDARREKIDRFFRENCDTLRGVCMLQYRKAAKRLRLMRSAVDSLWVIARVAVPIVCVELIFQYLRNSELENIIKATNMEGKSYVENFDDENDVIDEAMVVE